MSERVLGELADLTVGHVGPMASEYVQHGVPFLRSLNIRPFRVELDGVKFISTDFHERLGKSALKPGDVVVVRTGAPGTAAVIPQSLPVANCSDVVIVRPGPDLDAHYLAYLINSVARGYIDSRTVGAVQQHFNVGAAKGIPIPAASLEQQRRIAAVLGSIDDLIENYRSLANSAVELTKAALNDAPSSAEFRVCDVADVRRGLSYKGAGLSDAGMPMVNMGSAANFGWLKRDGWKFYTGDFKQRHVAKAGDLIITNTEQTWRQEIIGWPLLVPDDVPEALFTHHTYLVDFRPEFRWLRLPLWAHLFTHEARSKLDGAIRGTTVANLPIDAVEEMTFPAPAPDQSAAHLANSLLRSAWSDEVAAAGLERTRDELLPLLVSGKVRVSEGLAVA